MNSQSHEQTPSFDLPMPQGQEHRPPSLEQPSLPPAGETPAVIATEQGISAGPPPAAPANDAAGAPQFGAAPPPADPGLGDASGLASSMPQIADDTDLIEKEWVEKAKQIVERTAHDPYLQNNEMNKVKVDYLKKRYNKEIKLSEE